MTVTGVGHCRQVGCPESGIDEAVAKLVARGYKVGRMEQMETAAEAKQRDGSKACIRRELLHVHTPATLVGSGLARADAIHLLALWETTAARRGSPAPAASSASSSQREYDATFGFAFLDAASGAVCAGETRDDFSRNGLRALLAQVNPSEVLVPKVGLAPVTRKLLKHPPFPVKVSALGPDEFDGAAGADELRNRLRREHPAAGGGGGFDRLVETAGPGALTALGALAAHLERMKAAELLRGASYAAYDVYRSAAASASGEGGVLRLDGPTLMNLEILESGEGTPEGSLVQALDTCASPAGKRLLRRWLCHPLAALAPIARRQDAVELFLERPDLAEALRAGLRRLPDLERALGHLRAVAAPPPVAALPLYVLEQVQAKRIQALGTAVQALRRGLDLVDQLRGMLGGAADAGGLVAALLARCPGRDDAAATDALTAEGELVFHRAPAGKKGARQKDRWAVREAETVEQQVELTTELIALVAGHAEAWGRVAAGLAQLDVLAAFAQFAATAAGPTCRPVLVDGGGAAANEMDLRDLWHPVLGTLVDAVVPNDLRLGAARPASLLLTGPNMGGKTTLLRSVCLAALLAQCGCWVPCRSGRLHLVDTIFTRLGASDNIMAGESTFMVECREASAILRNATPRSLVVLDELGRGTSTFDGYAIAAATFAYLVREANCRLLFATHYHALANDLRAQLPVALGHMACLVHTGTGGKDEETITFLYRLKAGVCPRSYGVSVARLAGVPETVLKCAAKRGAEHELALQGAFGGGARLDGAEADALRRVLGVPNGVPDLHRLIEVWGRLGPDAGGVPEQAAL